ncbi:MAG: hypothetical protein V4463_21385 [Pseudomonadota bacterium]
MNAPTREESDAKLATADARIDARVRTIEKSNEAILAAIANLKNTMFVTAVSTVLAIVFGIATFNATVLSNMLASFESGKNTAAAQADVKRADEEYRHSFEESRRAIEENSALIRSQRDELRRMQEMSPRRQQKG